MEKEKQKDFNKTFIIFSIISLIILLLLGLKLSYDKGVYDGMKLFCDEDIGFDSLTQEYVCYNKENYDLQHQNNKYEYNIPNGGLK